MSELSNDLFETFMNVSPPALAFLITLAALISAAKLVLDGFWYRDWFLLAGGVAAACVGLFTVQQISP